MTAQRSRPGPQPMAHRKAQDRALILPLLGLILWMPPFADVFELDAKVAGVPFLLIYLFVVWALLILGAWRLSRHLGAAVAAPPPAAETERGD